MSKGEFTATITKPKTFVDNEALLYTDLNSLMDTIYNEFNGSISNTNLDSSAAIAYSKLSLSGAVLDTDISSAADIKLGTISFVIDGGGYAITTGIKGDLEVPFNCSIIAYTMLADKSGSIVVDVWKDTYASYPPTDADSITASSVPTISSTTKAQNTTLTGWTTSITAGQTLRFNVDSCTTITRVVISLKYRKS
jgi:hypothetical protein